MARRRLAAIAATNARVQEALAPAGYSGLVGGEMIASGDPVDLESSSALQMQLDLLAQDIVATPGAGGALLAAYAAQARALTMVVEASKRAGRAPLPQAVLSAAEAALATPAALMGLTVA